MDEEIAKKFDQILQTALLAVSKPDKACSFFKERAEVYVGSAGLGEACPLWTVIKEELSRAGLSEPMTSIEVEGSSIWITYYDEEDDTYERAIIEPLPEWVEAFVTEIDKDRDIGDEVLGKTAHEVMQKVGAC